jgi:hypothetical protein
MLSWDSIPKALRDHVGLIASVLLAGFIALRVFAVSGFQYQTAFVVLQSQGSSAILMGTVIPAFPVIPLAAAAVCMAVGVRRESRGESSRALTVVTITLMICTLMISEVGLLVVGLPLSFFGVLALHGFRRLSSKAPAPPSGRLLAGFMYTILAIAMLAVTFTPKPWLPYERVGNGRGHVDGYVLGSRDGELVILRDEHRQIVIVPEGAPRRFCLPSEGGITISVPWIDFPDWIRRSPAELWADTRPAVECNKSKDPR